MILGFCNLQEGRKIVTVKDVEPEKFISAFSQHLKRQGAAARRVVVLQQGRHRNDMGYPG